ncbi:2-hydroxychromene-2-carboxylate isomerase [Roseibium denhamense]|uniref:2-hydroxychromene-2-carboxylate isomerase n=1 Tax=Roseibium denhamense TaxID=76305 RepID=A0ABY1PCU4_9HYPH|nr:2-hydroxychromene-2-carboxylate isomerase [Roseibium denhamense]MTI07390.1 2-hydroxychromene-2-carboxylate isomerase [Roseibium denhamense]SMP29324.1 2-hydroxychromene-2-carboxylate isomerase [Roseibium denhamense]
MNGSTEILQGEIEQQSQRQSGPVLEFWFEFASTYSYLSAMRIETLAQDAGLTVAWRPFLLGPIFKKHGWSTSPFNLYPAKGLYMWRDMERECEKYGLPLRMPVPFPQNSLLAARLAFAGQASPWIGQFVRSVFMAEFGQGEDISDPALLSALLMEAGAPAKDMMARAEAPETKAGLRTCVTEAEKRGIFGAPSFVASDGDLFWGNDRLEDSIAAAAKLAGPGKK